MRFGIFLAAAIFFAPALASAAVLEALPANVSVSAGNTFSINVSVTSTDQALNAVSGTLSYPPATLEVVSVSKASSILTLWVGEPAFSNSDGTVNFSGVVPNPGYTGSRGKVFSIVFRAKKAGSASIAFGAASVLANDGSGTNILTSALSSAVSVSGASIPPPPPDSSAIVITSSTHPKQTAWYKATDVKLAWTNLSGTTAVRVGYDKNAQGQPTVSYGTISNKDITLGEGVWYFHVQDQTASGWSTVSTFKVQIDTTPPQPVIIKFPHGANTSDPRPIALFNTTDTLSGIDHYALKINGNNLYDVTRADVESNPYSLPDQDPGEGTLTVVAYDEAGNSTTDTADFEVTGIQKPKLDPIKDLSQGDIFLVSGIALPNARVDAYLTDGNGVETNQWTRTSSNGAFRIIWQSLLTEGDYSVTAQTTDDKGARSIKTDPATFSMKPQVLVRIGNFLVLKNNLPFLIGILIVVLAALFWYFGTRFLLAGYHIGGGSPRARKVLHQQFEDLKDALADEIHSLEKVRSARDLTVEEERLINRFSKMLDKAEGAIDKELDHATIHHKEK